MAVQVEKVIHAFIGAGITASFSKLLTSQKTNYNLDILWANGESALEYGIDIDAAAAKQLIEALQIIIEEKEKN